MLPCKLAERAFILWGGVNLYAARISQSHCTTNTDKIYQTLKLKDIVMSFLFITFGSRFIVFKCRQALLEVEAPQDSGLGFILFVTYLSTVVISMVLWRLKFRP